MFLAVFPDTTMVINDMTFRVGIDKHSNVWAIDEFNNVISFN